MSLLSFFPHCTILVYTNSPGDAVGAGCVFQPLAVQLHLLQLITRERFDERPSRAGLHGVDGAAHQRTVRLVSRRAARSRASRTRRTTGS